MRRRQILEEIQKAYEYADRKHKNQLRKSGEPYIIHPLAVAEIVAEIGLDTDAIVAALLHDCLEDTDASFDEISHMFGQTVAKPRRGRHETHARAVFHDRRAADGKSAQDVHGNVQGHPGHPDQNRRPAAQYPDPAVPDAAKQISKSMETMEVYAPLAHRLGMQKIKWELEDTSLQYLDPEGLSGDHRLPQKKRGQRQQLHERHPVEDHRAAGLRRHPRVDLRADQAYLLHLPQDARAEQDDRRAVRPLRVPRDRRQHRRLL